jgi:hypothetical protein
MKIARCQSKSAQGDGSFICIRICMFGVFVGLQNRDLSLVRARISVRGSVLTRYRVEKMG